MAKESQTYSVNLGGLGSFPTRVVNSNPNGTFIFVFWEQETKKGQKEFRE